MQAGERRIASVAVDGLSFGDRGGGDELSVNATIHRAFTLWLQQHHRTIRMATLPDVLTPGLNPPYGLKNKENCFFNWVVGLISCVIGILPKKGLCLKAMSL